MIYHVAEKFKSIQGEGVYAGTPMAFIRFVGCSVGKTICQHCDTDFDKMFNWRGGGAFTENELYLWQGDYSHVCLTGGEPLDQDLMPILKSLTGTIHIETSGTVRPDWFVGPDYSGSRYWSLEKFGGPSYRELWTCVSPKPGFREDVVMAADEIKVIVPGLGNGDGWPTLEDAKRWADQGKIVYLQPRNGKFDVDKINLKYVQDLLAEYPQFRLSVQMHKILGVQ